MIFRITISVFIFFLLIISASHAQVQNDNCDDAFDILDPIEYCSGEMEFNHDGSTPSGFGGASCFQNNGRDVWFKFRAFATAANIVVSSLNGPRSMEIALYEGSCSTNISELDCASSGNFSALNLLENGLNIGQEYIIRVSTPDNYSGFFRLCINNFNPPVEPGQDCNTGSILCDKSPFVVQVLSGGGALPDEGDGSCLEGNNPNTITEDQSTWLKWTAANDGSLTFIIKSLGNDDIDFALYELTDIQDCGPRTLLRCVATSCDRELGLNSGLSLDATDFTEDFNCDPGEDSFVRFLDMTQGTSYGLLINNFSNTGIGFSIEFGGDGEFLGPIADFTIDPETGLSCDQDFTITDQSSFTNGNITTYSWDFGERAIPATSNQAGPHLVNYESFGQKFIVLTLETDLGCIVTEVLPLFAEPCCDDIDMIDIDVVDFMDPLCFDSEDGSVQVEASGTNGEFSYSIDDGDYGPTFTFTGLSDGEYKIKTIDIKGCEDSLNIDLIAPDSIIVNAGEDQTVDLGFSTTLDGSFENAPNPTICWTPSNSLSDSSILDPEATPFGTTTYTLTVKDENDCSNSDEVTISTEADREIIAPNIFSPKNQSNGSPGLNDFFNIFGSPSIQVVERLVVFDRWGNKVYSGSNIPHNQYDQGWDGNFNGAPVAPGVYAWYAKVRFLDQVVEEIAGDITVIR